MVYIKKTSREILQTPNNTHKNSKHGSYFQNIFNIKF